MAKEIIIQPGMPKTGTTTLQNRFFQHHTEYLYLGKHNYGSYYTYDEQDRDKWLLGLKRNLISKDLSFFKTFDLEKILIKEFGDVYHSYDKLLLSEEDILARCITPGRYGNEIQIGSAYDIFEKLELLCDTSKFSTVKIILTLRKQDDLIESFFAEEYENFRSFLGLKNPRQFVEDLFDNKQLEPTYSMLRYDSLVQHLDKLFGRENVLVLPYEQMKTDPERFLCDLSSFMGIKNWDNIDLLRKVRDNNRDDKSGGGKIAKVRPLRKNLAELKRKLLGDVSTGLGRRLKFLDKFQRNTIVTLDSSSREKVMRNYTEENKRLEGRVKYISNCSYY